MVAPASKQTSNGLTSSSMKTVTEFRYVFFQDLFLFHLSFLGSRVGFFFFCHCCRFGFFKGCFYFAWRKNLSEPPPHLKADQEQTLAGVLRKQNLKQLKSSLKRSRKYKTIIPATVNNYSHKVIHSVRICSISWSVEEPELQGKDYPVGEFGVSVQLVHVFEPF